MLDDLPHITTSAVVVNLIAGITHMYVLHAGHRAYTITLLDQVRPSVLRFVYRHNYPIEKNCTQRSKRQLSCLLSLSK